MSKRAVSATLDQDLYDALMARAVVEERTQGVIIRRALRDYLIRTAPPTAELPELAGRMDETD